MTVPKKEVTEEPKTVSTGTTKEIKPDVIEPKPDLISIERVKFDKMLQDLEMLKTVADKSRMNKWMNDNKGEQYPVVCLRELNGKIIMGWRSIKNEVFQNTRTKGWEENQVIEVIYEDKSTEQMPLKLYVENYRSIACKQIGKMEEGGEVILKLVRKDNDVEYSIDVRFVN